MEVLATPNGASSGQSDLFYHYVACRLTQPPQGQENYVTLAEAITLCRQGHGDAQTITLIRLADHLEWIPELV